MMQYGGDLGAGCRDDWVKSWQTRSLNASGSSFGSLGVIFRAADALCPFITRTTELLAMLDEARHHMARHYLSNSVLELNEAAYLHGHEDAVPSYALSAARKEFHQGTGVKPTARR